MHFLITTIICILHPFWSTIPPVSTAPGYLLNEDALALFAAIRGETVTSNRYPNANPSYVAMMDPPMQFEKLPIECKQFPTYEAYRYEVNKNGSYWNLLALFNEQDDILSLRLNLDKMFDIYSESKTTKLSYIVYDVFTKQIIGLFTGEAVVSIKPNSARLMAIKAYEGYPLLLSIGNHIGQGFYELTSQRWDDAISSMTVTTKGLNHMNTTVRLYVPEGWKLRSLAVQERSMGWKEYQGQIYEFTIPDADHEVTWIATFDGGLYDIPYERMMSDAAFIEVIPNSK